VRSVSPFKQEPWLIFNPIAPGIAWLIAVLRLNFTDEKLLLLHRQTAHQFHSSIDGLQNLFVMLPKPPLSESPSGNDRLFRIIPLFLTPAYLIVFPG